MSDKKEYVRRESAKPHGDHHCHWPGCDQAVPPAKWGCYFHWMKLPKRIRDKIWAAFVPGQEKTKTPSRAYMEAAREAQEWIRENHDVD